MRDPQDRMRCRVLASEQLQPLTGQREAVWRASAEPGDISEMAMITDRLNDLGVSLPPSLPSAGMYPGMYLSCVVDENLTLVGGHGPVDGDRVIRGKVGRDLTLQ